LPIANQKESFKQSLSLEKKMSLTLTGELFFFAHDGSLLGYSPDERDDPAGDDFNTRCKAKVEGVWIDPNEGVWDGEPAEEADDDGDDSYKHDGEVRSLYARFIAMTAIEQDVLIDDIKMHLCGLIGVHPSDWEPSNEFVLAIIETETPETALRDMVLALYVATRVFPETKTVDVPHDLYSDEKYAEFDIVNTGSEMLSRRATPFCSRFESRRDYRRDCGINLCEYNHRSHTRCVTRARTLGKKEARRLACLYDGREVLSAVECEGGEELFLSMLEWEDRIAHRILVSEWTAYLGQEQRYTMTYDEFLATADEWLGVNDHVPFSHWDWPLPERSFYDWDYCPRDEMDDFDGFQHGGDDVGENCDECTDPLAEFADPWGDRNDIFEDYGDLSELFIGHSSKLRFTRRYRPTRRGLASIGTIHK
jgi:hypothetical protein